MQVGECLASPWSRTPSECKAAPPILIVMFDQSGPSAEVLLVREALAGEIPGARAILARHGWSSTRQGTFIVVFDPFEQNVRGAAVVRRRCHCTYELAAWAVGDDRVGTIEHRLVRAVADRVRRGGGRRVVVSLCALSPEQVAVLTASGFIHNAGSEVELVLDD